MQHKQDPSDRLCRTRTFARACAPLTAHAQHAQHAGQGSLCEAQLAIRWCPTQDWPYEAACPACEPVTAATEAPARGRCRSGEHLSLHLQRVGGTQPGLLTLSSDMHHCSTPDWRGRCKIASRSCLSSGGRCHCRPGGRGRHHQGGAALRRGAAVVCQQRGWHRPHQGGDGRHGLYLVHCGLGPAKPSQEAPWDLTAHSFSPAWCHLDAIIHVPRAISAHDT